MSTETPNKPNRHFVRILKILTVDGDPGPAIYGTFTAGAVIAAESTRAESLWLSCLGVELVVLLYWLAHAYSRGLSRRVKEREALSWKGLIQDFKREFGIVEGASIPLAVVVIVGIFSRNPVTALSVGIWVTCISLVAYELLAGIAIGLRRWALVSQAAIGGLLAVGIALLKAIS